MGTHWHSVSSYCRISWEGLEHSKTRQSTHCSQGMAMHSKSCAAEESRAWQGPAWLICVHTHLLILHTACGDALQGYFACRSLCSVFCLQTMLMLSWSGDNLPGGPHLWGSVHIPWHKDASQRSQQRTGTTACRPSSLSWGAHSKSSIPQFHRPERFNFKIFLSCCFPCRGFVLIHTLVFSIFTL